MRFDGDEREGIGGERERERVMGDTRFRFFFFSFFARENKIRTGGECDWCKNVR